MAYEGVRKAKKAAVNKRRAQAIEYKLAGMTHQQIADALGYTSRADVVLDINRALEQAVMDRNHNADMLIEEQLAVLDRLRRANWANAMKGDSRAADVVLKTVDRTAKLLRLYPDNANQTVNVFTMDSIEKQIAELTKQMSLEGSEADYAEIIEAAAEPGRTQALPPGRAEEASDRAQQDPAGEAEEG